MELNIKYENGQMTIRMNTFFPTSASKLKKLLKIIDLDMEHRDDHIRTLKRYFKNKVQELEKNKNSSGKKAVECRQKVVDLAAVIESKKHPNGVKLTKDELTKAKEERKHFVSVQAKCVSEFNRCIRQKEQFLKHLEILE